LLLVVLAKLVIEVFVALEEFAFRAIVTPICVLLFRWLVVFTRVMLKATNALLLVVLVVFVVDG